MKNKPVYVTSNIFPFFFVLKKNGKYSNICCKFYWLENNKKNLICQNKLLQN